MIRWHRAVPITERRRAFHALWWECDKVQPPAVGAGGHSAKRCVYLPSDPEHPEDTLARIHNDTHARGLAQTPTSGRRQ